MSPATQITEIESYEWELDLLADYLSQGDEDEQEENKELDDDFHDANVHLKNVRLSALKALDLSTPPSSQSLPEPLSQSLFLPPTATSVRTPTSAQRANKVSADLDKANILPEGVIRRKKKTRKKRTPQGILHRLSLKSMGVRDILDAG